MSSFHAFYGLWPRVVAAQGVKHLDRASLAVENEELQLCHIKFPTCEVIAAEVLVLSGFIMLTRYVEADFRA